MFNVRGNEDYIGPLPDKSYYGFDDMKTKDEQDKFLTWYNDLKNANYVFNFREEILKYCRSDVDILRRCVMKFRDQFIAITQIDPLKRCITIASGCNLTFRAKFLQEDTIGIIPPCGYQPERKYSIKALKWLKWVSHREQIRLQHARNGGEYKIGAYAVDGYHAETRTVYR